MHAGTARAEALEARVCPLGLRFPRLLLVLLTLAAFANSLANGFVWIDHWQIESGGLLAHSWRELWQALSQPLGAMPGWEGSAPYARPAVVALLSLVQQGAGLNAPAYHLMSVVLHLGNVLLVYGLLRDLSVARGPALAASAVFAVHPLQTAAVSWISGLADPLFTLFVLLAFRLYLLDSALARLGALLSFAVALGAKETAMVFPILLGAAYLLPSMRSRSGRSRAIAALAPLLCVLAAGVLYRLWVLQAGAFGRVGGGVPFSVRLRTVPHLLLSYVTLPLRFTALTVCDDYGLSTRWDPTSLLSLAAVLALTAMVVRWWRRLPLAAFGIVWTAVGLLPVLGITPILHYRADRFFYFPMIGWSLAAVTLAQHAFVEIERRRILSSGARRAVTAGVTWSFAALLVILTVRRNALFADDLTLFEATVHVSPLCREARTALGDAYLRAGRSDEAVQQYQAALPERPDRASYVVPPKVLINLGMAHIARNEFGPAADAFAAAHRLQPGLLHPLFGLGISNLGLGRVAAAADWLTQAQAIDPTDPDVTLNLALAYDRLGRAADAVRLYQRYLESTPHGRARALAEERLRALRAAGGAPPP